MPGEFRGDFVVVTDPGEASQLHNRGYYGIPQPGGSLKLTLLETAFLVETNRIEVGGPEGPLTVEALLRRGHTLEPGFEIRYLVYRELRQRGYVVKLHKPPLDFRVFPRGGSPSRTPSKWWVAAISERALFNLEGLIAALERTADVHKSLLLAVVDEESDVTYYEVRRVWPKGKAAELALPPGLQGLLLGDRVAVMDPASAQALHAAQFFGKPVGVALQLSLIEAAFLCELGLLILREARGNLIVTLVGLKRLARKLQPDFALRLAAYRDLKARGLIVKTGFKFGAHFRVYEGDPDKVHAKYLVHAVPTGYEAMWPEISRIVRLAHGVRKEILLGEVGERRVGYIELDRFRP